MTPVTEPWVLRNGLVVDGTGTPGELADVVVRDGRIAALVTPGTSVEGTSVDVTGLTVCPGFVDIHTHADFSLPRFGAASSMVRQGVTTLLVGNCGFSAFPVGAGERGAMLREYTAIFGRGLDWSWTDLDGFAAALETVGTGVNVGTLVGHGSVRIEAMGFDRRDPEPGELDRMRSAVAAAMDAGAFGLSSGLIYPPGSYGGTDELVSLCEVVEERGGFYATHMRNEGEHLLRSVEETLEISRRSGVALQMSHHKVLGQRNWGLTVGSLGVIDEAIAAGMDVTLDQYPYPASSTTMVALMPPWSVEGGTERMRERLADAGERQRIRDEVLDGPTDGRPKRDFEPDTVMISSVGDPSHASLVGRRLDEIAAEQGVEPVDAMLDLLGADAGVEVVIFAIGEEDIERVMRHPRVAVASDGWTLHPDAGGTPHPRSYGTFVRVLGEFVRRRQVLTLPEAVRRMTSLPAGRMGLTDRGRVAAGHHADLVVFDPETVAETATFLEPHSFAAGVRHVFVNGEHVVADGEETGLRPGRFLRHHAAPA